MIQVHVGSTRPVIGRPARPASHTRVADLRDSAGYILEVLRSDSLLPYETDFPYESLTEAAP